MTGGKKIRVDPKDRDPNTKTWLNGTNRKWHGGLRSHSFLHVINYIYVFFVFVLVVT